MRAMWRTLTLLVLVLFSYISNAQLLTGIWKGYGTQGDGSNARVFEYELNLVQTGKEVSGYSIFLLNASLKSYGKFELSGSYVNGVFTMQETKLLESKNMPPFTLWCLKSAPLRVQGGSLKLCLSGDWTGITEYGSCVPGKLYAEKQGKEALYTSEHSSVKPLAQVMVSMACKDSVSQEPIQTRIELFEKDSSVAIFSITAVTLSNLALKPHASYRVLVKKQGYYWKELLFDTKEEDLSLDLALKKMAKEDVLQIPNVYFEQSTPVLKEESKQALDKLALFLLDNPTIKIEIVGHTDNVGNKDLNLMLSRRRAIAVANYLLAKGVKQSALQTDGMGGAFPIAPNDTEANKSKNRRVEMRIVSVE